MTTLAARLARVAGPTERIRPVVELGHEPPITIGEPRVEGHERRRLSGRWLAGVALCGLSGLALIGSALYLDLDEQSNFAEAPEIATAPHHEEAEGVNPSKGDRLVRPIDVVAAKQTYKVPTTIKIGDKEVVRSRPFTILSTALTLTPNAYADAVPAFDPLSAMGGAAEKADAAPDPGPVQDDAEVSFSQRDLNPGEAATATGELTLAEAQAQVAEMLKSATNGEDGPALPSQLLLKRTSQAGIDPLGGLSFSASGPVNINAPFASIEVKMVPENVTEAAKTPAPAASGERMVQLRHGESFEDLLRANGASKDAASAILAAFGLKSGDSPVAEGQKVILQYDESDTTDKTPAIGRVSVYAEEQLKSTIAVNDAGAYVPVTLPRTAGLKRNPEADSENGGLNLYESFYQTALKQDVPKPIIDEMVRAFANDVDFQRSTQPGDSVTAFIADADEVDPHPQLLYAMMNVRDQTFKYYRFQTPDDGLVDFYDENGRSVRKFLIRKPIIAGEMTSPFGMRFHPILHYSRMHTGVDWGAPIGTPILAAGNGTIIKAAYDSGYGRRIEIQHANGYVTTYNHMSGFARDMAAGVRVTQGQVIGYLGQSGLATGPHLHYEVIINGNFVDPMAIKLARTREFDGKMLASFKHERDRIDQLMNEAPGAASAAPPPPTGPAAVSAKLN